MSKFEECSQNMARKRKKGIKWTKVGVIMFGGYTIIAGIGVLAVIGGSTVLYKLRENYGWSWVDTALENVDKLTEAFPWNIILGYVALIGCYLLVRFCLSSLEDKWIAEQERAEKEKEEADWSADMLNDMEETTDKGRMHW